MEDWKKIEALLFASGKYLAEEYISSITELKGAKLKAALKKLEEHYANTDTSLKLFREKDEWKLNIQEEYSPIVNKIVAETELPSYVMATLAVIAYKNPVLQSEVVDVRGSNAYEHIKMLEEKGFIKKEKHGRTYKLKVSDKFFEYFDVKSEADIQGVFKQVKKPEKLGSLEVYDEEENNNNEFSEKVLERMKKVDKKDKEDDREKDYLESFEERIKKVKQDIDEAESELGYMSLRPEGLIEEENLSEELEQQIQAVKKGAAEQPQQQETEKTQEEKEEFIKKINEDIDKITREQPEEEKD